MPLSFIHKLPLRVTLIVPFALVLVLTMSSIAWLSLRNGQMAVNQVAEHLQNGISERISDQLNQFVNQVQLINQMNVDAFQLNQFSLADTGQLQKHFWKQIQHFKDLYSIYYGDAITGQFQGANRVANQQQYQITFATAETGQSMWVYSVNTQGEFVGEAEKLAVFDPRSRPWYQEASKQGKAIWSEIYTDFSSHELMLTAAQPSYLPDGTLRGVLAVDVELKGLNAFLRGQKVGKTGKTFIIDHTGTLVANSSNSPNYDEKNKPIQATAIKDPQIQASAQYLKNQLGTFKNLKQVQFVKFDWQGQMQWLQIVPWKNTAGLEWLVVVVLPEQDFMQEIHNNTLHNLLLMGIALLLTGIIAWRTTHWVVRPLADLNHAAQRIANGEWDQHLPLHRRDEIGELALTFNQMGNQLRSYFATLEQRVAERTQELANAYRKLKASQAQLVQSEKMASLGQMVAGIAHEMNTPLGYIKNNVELTRRLLNHLEELIQQHEKLAELMITEPDNQIALQQQLAMVAELDQEYHEDEMISETQELLKDTLYGIEQISELVMNLKNFSRLDQAKIANVNLNENLDSVLLIANSVLKHKVQIDKQYGDIPAVSCSPSQLNQVFLNLITNAAQAIEHEQGKITLKTSADEHFVQVSIQDNGKGIPKDVIAKIFDPFFTTKPIGQGTGLGLSISHQIVTQHGGKIKVASQEGKGTRFVVFIPRQLKRTEENTNES